MANLHLLTAMEYVQFHCKIHSKNNKKESLQRQNRTSNKGMTNFLNPCIKPSHSYVQGQKGKLIDSICQVERIDFKKLETVASPKIDS